MASEVGICNQALSWLGGDIITSLDDNSREAILCNANYTSVRDAVLEAHDWTFAIARLNLPKSSESPVNGYTNAFPIPSEVLRILDVNNGQDWRVEGRNIVTNEDAAKIRAVVRVTDPNDFSALFVQALAARLAADLAIPLTKNVKFQKQHYEIYMAKLAEAFTNDGMQGKSRKITSSWLRAARVTGGRNPGPIVGSGNNAPGG